MAREIIIVKAVNFSAASLDYPINIVLPTGYTFYVITGIRVFNASGTLNAATCGVFTSSSGGGTTIVASGTTLAISSPVVNTSGSTQALTIIGANTTNYNLGTIYFRVLTPQSGSVFANVTTEVQFLS